MFFVLFRLPLKIIKKINLGKLFAFHDVCIISVPFVLYRISTNDNLILFYYISGIQIEYRGQYRFCHNFYVLYYAGIFFEFSFVALCL